MPASRTQTLRSSVTGQRPTGQDPGTLFVNFADRQIGYLDPAKASKDLIPITFFSAAATYAAGQMVVEAGAIYTAKAVIPAGAFNVANWDPIVDLTDLAPLLDAKVDVAGDTMTGPLVLPAAAPTVAGHATRKGYVDAQDAVLQAAINLKLSDAPVDGLTYGRKDAAWSTVIGGASMLDGPPPPPLQNGQLWFETDSGNTYCYYVDPSGAPGQWVQISGSLAVPLPPSIDGALISDTPPSQPQIGQMWFQSTTGRLFVWYSDGSSSQWVQISGPLKPEFISSVAQDMFAGFTTGARFVVNSKVDGSGANVLSMTDQGGLQLRRDPAVDGRAAVDLYAGMAAGTPQGALVQFFTEAGARRGYLWDNPSAPNAITLGADPAVNIALNTAGTGAIGLTAGGTGAVNLTTNGAGISLTVPSNQAIGFTIAGVGGWAVGAGGMLYNQLGGSSAPLKVGYLGAGTQYGMTLRSGSSTGTAIEFSTSGGTCGYITVSGTTTAYITSSDERLKDFIGEYDPDEAIRIIRADPVRAFHWKKDGSFAVGWGAQTSYEISPDLATPPILLDDETKTDDIDDPEFKPWGTDQAKRTPYLWAALSRALDKIDALEARLAQLEAR